MSIQEQFELVPQEAYPNHIALLPNGNRTWARTHGLSEQEGHKIGVEVLIKFARSLRKLGIHTATVWGMSTENIRTRNPAEIANVVKLLHYVLDTTAQEAHEDGARLIHIGNKDMLPKEVVEKIVYWEEKTSNNTKHVANVAFGYGGHDELLRAFKKAMVDIKAGKITFEDLYKEDGKYHGKYPYMAFKNYLDTKDQPYPFPDLIIRNNNELRLSGFMPWQSVYSEFYPCPKLLPEMTEDDFKLAIIEYAKRNRKFGGDATSAKAEINKVPVQVEKATLKSS